jgi:hypothetical protein
MTKLLLRLSLCLVLLDGVTACAAVGPAREDPFLAAVSRLPRFPACEAEIGALVSLVRLARQLGSNWQVYEPALQALQDQAIDCVEDSYPNLLGI